MKIKGKKLKNEAGITLFIAVIVISILVFISFATISITLKSTLFASSGRDSQYAFYASDAGLECAVYWDAKFDPSKFDISVSGSPISCAGDTNTNGEAIYGTSTSVTATVRIGGGGVSNPTSSFGFVMNQPGLGNNLLPLCAIVTVEKRQSDGKTYIKSHGYNTCDTGNPMRVERGIEINY